MWLQTGLDTRKGMDKRITGGADSGWAKNEKKLDKLGNWEEKWTVAAYCIVGGRKQPCKGPEEGGYELPFMGQKRTRKESES